MLLTIFYCDGIFGCYTSSSLRRLRPPGCGLPKEASVEGEVDPAGVRIECAAGSGHEHSPATPLVFNHPGRRGLRRACSPLYRRESRADL
jgi:hypothetical protein